MACLMKPHDKKISFFSSQKNDTGAVRVSLVVSLIFKEKYVS